MVAQVSRIGQKKPSRLNLLHTMLKQLQANAMPGLGERHRQIVVSGFLVEGESQAA